MSPDSQQEPPVADPAAGPLAAFRGGASGSAGRVLAFKFGGSSLLGAERMLHAAQLIREAACEASVVVVVSAMKGVTDSLLGIAASVAGGRGSDAIREADHLFYLHVEVLRELRLDPSQAARVASELRFLGKDLLDDVAEGVQHAAFSREALEDRLASYGERFSARLLVAALEKSGVSAVPVSSSEFVLTCDTFRDAQPTSKKPAAVAAQSFCRFLPMDWSRWLPASSALPRTGASPRSAATVPTSPAPWSLTWWTPLNW